MKMAIIGASLFIILLALGTCAVKTIQNDAVEKAKEEQIVKTSQNEAKRMVAVANFFRRQAAKDSARADSAIKEADKAQDESDKADTSIATADSAADATMNDDPENQDWHMAYLAMIPRIQARDDKIAAQTEEITSLRSAYKSDHDWGLRGWHAADSLQVAINDLNTGIKAALEVNKCGIGPSIAGHQLPCPSRKGVAVVAAVLGSVTTAVIMSR